MLSSCSVRLGVSAKLLKSIMKFLKTFFFLFALCVLSACATKSHSIKEMPFPKQGKASSTNVTPSIRIQGLEQAAMSFGAQSSLAWTSQGINQSLAHDKHHLNKIFNFRALLLSHNVLPPVLSEGDNAVATDNPNSLRLADKVYKIEKPPRFVTAPPTWRDYLWMDYKIPDKPNVTLLPKTREEDKIWNTYYDKGWKAGVVQANGIFAANMGRLKRDYAGMILYRKLLAQNMVTPPFVAKSNLGITGDKNQIRIRDQVLRITATSELIKNSKKWHAIVVPAAKAAQ